MKRRGPGGHKKDQEHRDSHKLGCSVNPPNPSITPHQHPGPPGAGEELEQAAGRGDGAVTSSPLRAGGSEPLAAVLLASAAA